MTDKKLKVIFSPGCFDGFEGSEEELAELLAEIHKMAEDGTIMENARQLSEEEEEDLLEHLKNKEKRQ
jgi:hypothetical protein